MGLPGTSISLQRQCHNLRVPAFTKNSYGVFTPLVFVPTKTTLMIMNLIILIIVLALLFGGGGYYYGGIGYGGGGLVSILVLLLVLRLLGVI